MKALVLGISVREIARETTGHDKIVPSWFPDNCKNCGQELMLGHIVNVYADHSVQHVDCNNPGSTT
jgi:hypothetical protein